MSLKTLKKKKKSFIRTHPQFRHKHNFSGKSSYNYQVLNSAEAGLSCDLGPLWILCCGCCTLWSPTESMPSQFQTSCTLATCKYPCKNWRASAFKLVLSIEGTCSTGTWEQHYSCALYKISGQTLHNIFQT